VSKISTPTRTSAASATPSTRSTAQSGLRRKISTAFILQAAAISCATLLGIYATAAVLEDFLIRRALVEEATHYVKRLDADPLALEPDTHNMRGFLDAPTHNQTGLLPELRKLPDGFHNLRQPSGRPLVYVSHTKYGKLTLIFDQQHVGKLALLFGIIPMAIVLLFVYLASFAAYRLSKRAISPVVWLAERVSALNPLKPDRNSFAAENLPPDFDGESQILSEALQRYSERIEQLVERERTFTRDASHELRSPLTVIKMACEVLLADGALDAYTERNIKRVQNASRDMEALIEAFLLLSRDSESGMPEEEVSINGIVREEMARAEILIEHKAVQLQLEERTQLKLKAPSKVVGVLLSNLIRNACTYTESGSVSIEINDKFVRVVDTGKGIAPDDLKEIFKPFFRPKDSPKCGHGVGLAIVSRLSQRFQWPVVLTSEVGIGTVARIDFPQAETMR
jgi:signal transduction histidine kinase